MDFSLLGFIKASKHREGIVGILGEGILTLTEISRALEKRQSIYFNQNWEGMSRCTKG